MKNTLDGTTVQITRDTLWMAALEAGAGYLGLAREYVVLETPEHWLREDGRVTIHCAIDPTLPPSEVSLIPAFIRTVVGALGNTSVSVAVDRRNSTLVLTPVVH